MKKILIGIVIVGSVVFANPANSELKKIDKLNTAIGNVAVQMATRDITTKGKSVELYVKLYILAEDEKMKFYKDNGDIESVEKITKIAEELLHTLKNMETDAKALSDALKDD